jgi:hypothetical protein
MNNKDVLIISVLTFITVVVWIAADAWHAYVTSTISSSLQQTIKPLNPKLDLTVLETLKSRQTFR